MSTDHRPSVDQLLTDTSVKYRPTISDQLSAKCRRNVGEVSVNEKLYRPRHVWNDYRPCLDRESTHYRPTIDRYIDRLSTERRPSIDRVSTDCRPSVDRLSTECRPLYRPISQSTLPTVNKIHLDNNQRVKKDVSDSLGLVDFVIGLAIFVPNLLDGQVLFLGEI